MSSNCNIIVFSQFNYILVFDINTGIRRPKFKTHHTNNINKVLICPDGINCISCCWDGLINIFNIDNGKLVKSI